MVQETTNPRKRQRAKPPHVQNDGGGWQKGGSRRGGRHGGNGGRAGGHQGGRAGGRHGGHAAAPQQQQRAAGAAHHPHPVHPNPVPDMKDPVRLHYRKRGMCDACGLAGDGDFKWGPEHQATCPYRLRSG